MNLKQMILRQQELLSLVRGEHREFTATEQTEFDNLTRQIAEATAEQSQTGGQPEAGSSGTRAPGSDDQNSRGQDSNRGMTPENNIALERSRCAEITRMCRSLGVDDATMEGYISGGASLDSVREAVMNFMIENNAPIPQRGSADVTAAEEDKFRAAASDALLLRMGLTVEKPAEGARDLRGMSLRDLYIESSSADNRGRFLRMSSDDLYDYAQRDFANPTAAFPAILDDAINKSIKEGYNKAAATFDAWTQEGSLKDFKKTDHYYLAGSAGELLEVPENGELKADSRTDTKLPQRQLKTYGRQFSLSRQAFINDDIDLVTGLPSRYSKAAKKTINKQCYQILVNSPAIYDGVKLFDKQHGNIITTGTGITMESVQAMMLALQSQTDPEGEAIIIRPATLIVPVGMAFEMYTLFNSTTINTEGNTQAANPLYRYAKSIDIVEDGTINVLCGGLGNTMPWFLVGNKDDVDFMQVDYLNGNKVPIIRRSEQVGKLGISWDIYLDWGITVLDYRGVIKNPGKVISNPIK